MPSDSTGSRLPEAPDALLAFLRDAEGRLDDLRFEIRALRAALEAEPRPKVETVGAAFSGEGTLSAGVVFEASGRVDVTSSTSGSATVVPSGSGESEWSGTTTGHAPPDPEISGWVSKVKKYGPTGMRIAEFVVRVWSLGG